MSITDLISYLEDLPRAGYIEIDMDGIEIYALGRDIDFTQTADGAVQLQGAIGYSIFSLTASTMLIDPESVRYVRHIEDIPR